MKGVDQSQISPSNFVNILNDDDPPTDINQWRGDRGFFKKYIRKTGQGKVVGLPPVHEEKEETPSESSITSLSSLSSTPLTHPLILDKTKIVTNVVDVSVVIELLSKSSYPPDQFSTLLDYLLSFSNQLGLDESWVKISDLPTPPSITPQRKS